MEFENVKYEIQTKCKKLFCENNQYSNKNYFYDARFNLFNDTIKVSFWKGQHEFTKLQCEMRTYNMNFDINKIIFKSDCYVHLVTNEILTVGEIYEMLQNNQTILLKNKDDFIIGMKDNYFFFSTKAINACSENILEFMTENAINLYNLIITLEF